MSRHHSRHLRPESTDELPSLREQLGAILIGVFAGGIAVAFHAVMNLAEETRAELAVLADSHSLLAEAGVVVACGLLAAAFNAPLSGVVFAFELLGQPFTTRNAFDTILACGIADWVCRMFHGPVLELPIVIDGFREWTELPAFALVGLWAGLVALVFQKLLLGIGHELFETSIAGMAASIGALFRTPLTAMIMAVEHASHS